ncbi:hypothetical protein, partial [Enterococcus faecium]|uniref:hypothetical protein n=1 Tax=Enterococcus faecium TaxID=1352 RepID=UPI0034E93F34
PSYQPISLQSLGLRHADLENETNLSRSGRIYDYGGIIVKQTEIARQQAEVDAALASGLRRWSRSPRAPRLPLPGRKPPGSVFAEERHQAAAKP